MAELFRDELGIPHLRADDVTALADAQGEATARDRGWQIEVDRLRGEGRLSEVVGESGLAWDVFARRARLDDTARRAFSRLDAETRAFVEAYVEGVRRGLRAATAAEFRALDERFGDEVERGEWPLHGPLAVMHVSHVLFTSYPVILWRAHVARTLGPAWVELFHAGEAVPTSGSNAWALHGSRTASGMPLLGGDPHRMFELPGVYQQVRLACDEFDVVGLTFPGVPGVQHFGHTGDAAWGITNAMAHGADVFRETLRRTAEGYEALGPDGWRPADLEVSTIRVRGGAEVEVEAVETERGPVVTDLHREGDLLVGWSVRLPARTDGDLGFVAILPLLRARTADAVVSAFEGWVDPVNRLLAADVAGDVRSATVGRVFERAAHERLLPRDARRHAPAPLVRMPRAVAVPDIAVDANERPERKAIDLGAGYAADYRARRIRALLQETRPRSVDEFALVWGDTDSASAAALLRHVPAGTLPAAEAAVRRQLEEWDHRMDAASLPAGVFAAWRAALVRRVSAHPALAPLHEPHGFGDVYDAWFGVEAHVALGLLRLLAHPALSADASSLAGGALSEVAAASPRAWGETHRLTAAHVLAGVPGTDDPAARLDIPLSGDGDTVRCAGSVPGVTDRSWRGSVARWAWDLADREQSLWNVPFGASGDPVSPHFADQLEAFRDVAPARVVTDWGRLRRAGVVGPRLLAGERGRTVHVEDDPHLGRIAFTVFDPDADVDLLHEWVTEPRARFWGLADLTRQELAELYAHVDSLPTHHAFLVRRDGEPVALLQTCEPEHDPVGARYPVQAGDVGIHFLLGARGAPVASFTTRLAAAIAGFLFAPPAAQRIVVEPDRANDLAVDRMLRLGFERGPEIDLPGKRAQLAFLTRAHWDARSSDR
ncbi:GNAT family N-acetyltransferase [Microbacterium sp. BK668]|uniref:GNAT family N-acetyltransferase n=1 Tax=Microbacterium sp. BK668 TaxID=2512118 RepID=UPI00105EF3FA|nr:GNAT family N-acetyltransferase [Microbacterium sp. BK668]TDN91749.1 penicillin amidase [Microbacterium sp. BK668]